ncbi:shikimate kinase domain-containing protein [Hirsutella rhossiliensis]|uniref:Gluconokinase n=1 Tax=Hirsutella rhossiliensis TaxID=111463 RepID=A0A9P8SL98_9HYPO|nr:shikimate kinase domain-containing protein [Hirsutella rhossiliensis]KAH0967248.1 shikimate kinase domain-containing protein [Hirsutella rhossiliensis]
MLSFDNAMPVNGQEAAASAGRVQAAPSKTSQPTTTTDGACANGQARKHHHIWLVTGPAGCGKTTVAEYLAKSLDMPYIEGDSHHTPANVEKMRSGNPLTDADRWDWLTALRDESMRRINRGSEGVVVTCSALKRKYRDVIRVAAYYDHDIRVHFIFLNAPAEVLLARVTKREGHYMGPSMVQSQFDILERPAEDERDVISIDVSRSIEEVKKDVLARVSDITKAVCRD